MPEQIDRCVAALMSDPEFKPQDGKSKEESAYAICTAQFQETNSIAQGLEGLGKPEEEI